MLCFVFAEIHDTRIHVSGVYSRRRLSVFH